jgi:hypothetical protein
MSREMTQNNQPTEPILGSGYRERSRLLDELTKKYLNGELPVDVYRKQSRAVQEPDAISKLLRFLISLSDD